MKKRSCMGISPFVSGSNPSASNRIARMHVLKMVKNGIYSFFRVWGQF
jgi:hypothetical protein